MRNCLIADNEDAGIFYEISYGLHAHDNVIVGNGFRETPGAWGAGAGISLSSSPDCVIERNLIVGNREGFNFREQNRTTPRIDDERRNAGSGTTTSSSTTTSSPSIAMPRSGAGSTSTTAATGPPPCKSLPRRRRASAARDLAASYHAKDKAGAPAGLTLEKLSHHASRTTSTYARPWQGLFVWGVEWKTAQVVRKAGRCPGRAETRTRQPACGVQVRGYPARDFRVPADSPALKMGCYPKGEIAGVKLGILPAR